MLAALGADVLRLDSPDRPELEALTVEGIIGKTSATLDFRTAAGLQTLHRLLDDADVLVTGYRPGALRRFGLDPDQVAERHPGTIVVTLSAWATLEPSSTTPEPPSTTTEPSSATTAAPGSAVVWSGRRGFDSLVQVATGIAWRTRDATGRPGALPCQLLDHATGYLAAAGALNALTIRERTGVASRVEVSLARTARWLLETSLDRAAPQDTPTAPFLAPLGGGWTGVAPPGTVDGAPLTWPRLPPAYGSAPAAWR
jgi:crotonobetainyl-CoA:carnitine CoA-transferase CaiB-like acyl-CoA transferase